MNQDKTLSAEIHNVDAFSIFSLRNQAKPNEWYIKQNFSDFMIS
jgi:hypothetical protein